MTQTAQHFYENGIERIARRKLGSLPLTREFMAAWERSREDVEFGAEFLLGTKFLPWQKADIFDAFDAGVVCSIGRLSNSGGKTSSFMLLYSLACATRRWARPEWPLYRAIHFTPLRDQGMETKIKIDEMLRNRAREQWDERKGIFRPAMIRHFMRAVKQGQNHGYEFFAQHDRQHPEKSFLSATLTLMPTAGKGESGEGSDPVIIGMDEGRHERNFVHIFYRIWIPRALRVETKVYVPYTSLEASGDLESIKYQAEQDTDGDFHQFDLELNETTNPTLRPEQVQRVLRILPKHIREQVRTGKASQPLAARFSARAIAQAYGPPPEPAIFSQIEGLRARMQARCAKCEARRLGHDNDAAVRLHEHLLAGACDPASSAKGADWTVFKVWDLDPPVGIAETVYTFTMEPGPRIQEVRDQLVLVGREIQGPMGFDRKSGIGHALEDLVVESADDIELVPIGWDTREEKVRDTDFFKALVEGSLWRSTYHHPTKTQMLNWVIDDRAMVQDHLMCEVICAKVAQPYLSFYLDAHGAAEEHRAPATTTADPYAGHSGSRYFPRERTA